MSATATQEAAVAAPPSRSRRQAKLLESLLPPLVALAVALVVGDLLILAFGESPAAVYRLLISGTWGNPYGLGQVFYKATTLTCTGLAFAIAARAGLFNIGAESQLAAGGFAAAAVGLLLPAAMPGLLAVPLLVAAALAGGATVGAVPGVLKARFGANEVIVTIMLNFIVLALLNYLVSAHLNVSETLHTPEFAAGRVPRFADVFETFRGSAANFTVFIVLAATAVAWWFLFRTRGGFELRAVGLQPAAAEYAGVRVGAVWIRAFVIAGALAGLGGINYVLGYKYYYEEGFAAGSGFMGIAVALIGRNHPLGIPLAALFFATLSQGGLAVNAVVPRTMVEVMEAVVILAVVMSVPEVRRALRSALRRRAA